MPETSNPLDWTSLSAPSLSEIETMATAAFARLPQHFRDLCEGLVIHVDDYPSEDVQREMDSGELDLMGLFQGVGLPHRSENISGQMPNMVWLYRVPMLLYWAEHEEAFGAVVTHVLVHEIGHHFGLSDEDMEAIEAAAN